jgi:hypothetical protein
MIYKQAYDLAVDLMPLTKNMDRGYKFTLGERINNAAVELKMFHAFHAMEISGDPEYLPCVGFNCPANPDKPLFACGLFPAAYRCKTQTQ